MELKNNLGENQWKSLLRSNKFFETFNYVVKFNASTLDNFDVAFQVKLYKQFAKVLVERLMAADSFIK